MKNAYQKDIWRSIKKTFKRFLSILVITALGVTVLTGIYAACQDMYHSADRFYDEQGLFDVRVLSTLGLTGEDVASLQAVRGVVVADGGYSETVHTEAGGLRQTAELTALSEKGLNRPYVLEGALPVASGEIAVTQKYLDASGKSLGDTLTIEEDLDGGGDSSGTADGQSGQPTREEPAEEESGAPGPQAANEEEEASEEDGKKFDADVDWDADVEIEEEPEEPTFAATTYTITGVVIDPMSISNNEGGNSFRSTETTDYTFFVLATDVNSDVYTSVYLTLEGLQALGCYSQEYEEAVAAVMDTIEAEIMKQREKARYDAVLAEALEKIGDAEDTMNEKFAEADELFADAWGEIENAKKEVLDGEAELTREEKDALQKLADARAELEDGKLALRTAEEELSAGERELEANAKTLEDGKTQLEEKKQEAEAGFATAELLFAEKQGELDAGLAGLQPGIGGLQQTFGENWPGDEWNALVSATAKKTAELLAADPEATPDPAAIQAAAAAEMQALQDAVMATMDPELMAAIPDCMEAAMSLGGVKGGQQMLTAQQTAYAAQKQEAQAQLDAAAAELAEGESKLNEGRQKLAQGREEINKAWQELAEGEEKLNAEEAKALRELADAWKELADGKEELAEGEAELAENEEKFKDKKTEAEEKLADAYAELEDIDMAQWYVQDRTSLDSYSSLKNDLSSIEAVGRAFPILFLLVAVLISLTTMTRMVEEERGLIGTYKALGFTNGAIYAKYLLYALLASLLGGVLGDFLGFVALPIFLMEILQVMYIIPNITLGFHAVYGFGGIALFVVSIVGATALACRSELKQTPAALMRPKAPRAGARVFLERIPLVWNRLKFLNKVTARNLFRYKKRLFMTVAGIMGCTALVLAGFAIKDSVADLLPKQYGRVYRYDVMLVADAADNAELLRLAEGEEDVSDYLNVRVENVKVQNSEDASESMQLMVAPEGTALAEYIGAISITGGEMPLPEAGVLITQNTSELLHLAVGDTVYLQNLQLDRAETVVAGIVENYLGNTVYVSQSQYEAVFGAYAPNTVLAHLSSPPAGQAAYAESLLAHDFVLSSVSIQGLRDGFADNFSLINAVLYLLIVLAAGLAFVVLFTLSNTNISERVRELATIKVLGFYDREVHSYVNKETLILTGIGVLAGLPVGRMVSGLLTEALKMPSIYFAVYVRPESYVFAGLISFSFALIVNLMTNRTLNRINMVEALKSVE